MDEPKRLVEDSGMSPLGRSLLASATSDEPGPDQRARAAKRLGIVALTLASGETGSAAGAAAAAGAAWWKAGIVVAVIGGVLAINAVAPWRSDEPEQRVAVEPQQQPQPKQTVAPEPPPPAPIVEPAPVVEPPAPPPVVEPKAPVRTPAHKVEAPPAPPPVPEPEPVPVVVEPAPPPVEPAPAPQTIDPRRLAAEVAVLDRARAALRKRDAATAIAALDEHRKGFADGALVAEAEVVRLEVLVETGQSVAAREQARMFLSRFPKSPLVRRVRSLVERVKETP